MFTRLLSKDQLSQDSCFLWGPHQSGKSTLLRHLFPESESPWYDLLGEVKSAETIASHHLGGLRAWKEEHPESRCILVGRTPRARLTSDAIEILPWREFLGLLWRGELKAES